MWTRSRQGALLWSLAIAAERGLPLSSALEPFLSHSSRWGWKVQALDKLLSDGTSLSLALESVPGLLPAESVFAIRVAAQTGLLADALKSEARRLCELESTLTTSIADSLTYVLMLLLVFSAISGFIMYYIIPKFKKIFLDFGMELPNLSVWIIKASDQVVEHFLPIVVIPLFLIFLSALRRSEWGMLPILGLRIPLPGRTRIQLPHLLRALRLAVRGERPLEATVATMSAAHEDTSLRKRLTQIQTDVAGGTNCWQSCCDNGLLRRQESAVLQAAERAGHLPWALSRLANHIERGLTHRCQLIGRLLEPILILVMAFGLGIFIVGMFLPLIKLINDLS